VSGVRYVLDPKSSTVHVFTYAEGLFARLAHDLRLTVADLTLTAERDGDGGSVSGEIPLGSLVVDGVMKKDTLREDVLSAHDRQEILEKMRADVFGGAAVSAAIVVRGELRGTSFDVTVEGPNGRSARAAHTVRGASIDEGERVRGEIELSLRALSGHDVKGPLGAFRISDRIRVAFDVTFLRAP